MIKDYSLKRHNSFGLDVVASQAFKVQDIHRLEQLYESNALINTNYLVLGGGSNCLFLDNYFDGLIVLMENKGIHILEESDSHVLVRAAAGEEWSDFVDQMVKKGYGGLENLSLIPGKLGAAPIQNIGAYGVEMKDCFVALKAMDIRSGQLVELSNKECKFGYRSSIFKTSHKNQFIILSVDFKLNKKPQIKPGYGAIKAELDVLGIRDATIAHIAEVVKKIRLSKLPDPAILGNAGSFFKNPIVEKSVFEAIKNAYPDVVAYADTYERMKIAAGWLIDKAGWKGRRIGDAGVHTKQALVLVNYGKASGRDIYNLAMEIKADITAKFGIVLEPEVNFI